MHYRLFAAGLAATGLAAASPALAQDAFELDSSGITWNGPGQLQVNVGGRLHIDTATYNDDVTPFRDRTDLRRARIESSWRLSDNLTARVDYDFAQVNDGWRNVWVQYRINDTLAVRGGNQIVPFSMEDMGSSNETTFMERSLASALAPGYGMGVGLRARGQQWSLIGGYYNEPIDTDFDNGNSQGRGVAVRGTFAPIRERRQVLHFGAGAQTRDMAASRTFRIQLRPESGISTARFLDTSRLAGIEGYEAYNLEAAYMNGPFSVQGEYARLHVRRSTRADPTFHAGYIQAGWVITGERRTYARSNGVLRGVNLRRGRQAFEVAARYSMADLDSETVTGGHQKNWTLGGNWYVNENVRVMVNYVNAEADPNRNGVREDLEIWQARLQLSF